MTRILECDLPDHYDPVKFIVNNKSKYRHTLSQYYMLSDSNLKEDFSMQLIGMAAGDTINYLFLLKNSIPLMPDEKSKEMLEILVGEMNKITTHVFTGEGLDYTLGKRREEIKKAIDSVIMNYENLANYLEPNQSE